jgi:iron complex transport system substrate-binding protein
MRLLSLHPITTELLFALGAGNWVAGRTDSCDYPEAAKRIPSIGKIFEIAQEPIAIFDPEIILASYNQDLLKGISAKPMLFYTPKTVKEMLELIQEIGKRIGKELEAEVAIHDLQAAFEKVQEKTQRFHKTKVFCPNPVIPAPLLAELVSLAGGELYLGDGSLESVQQFNPSLIIGDPQAMQQWQMLSAVQNERVFLVEESLLRPTPRLAEGACMLAKILHGVETITVQSS